MKIIRDIASALSQLAAIISSLCVPIIQIGFVLIFFAVIMVKLYAHPIPYVTLPTPSPTDLAYVLGAWWLFRKAG